RRPSCSQLDVCGTAGANTSLHKLPYVLRISLSLSSLSRKRRQEDAFRHAGSLAYAQRDAGIPPSSPRKRGPRACPPAFARGRLWHEQGATDRSMTEKRPCVDILASKRNG